MTKDEIIKLSDKELRIKAAELNGEKIVCEEWPCGYPPDVYEFTAADIVVKGIKKVEWITDTPQWYNVKWPVVLTFEGGYWPPKYSEQDDDYSADVCPIKDYPNDIRDEKIILGKEFH